MGGQPETKKNNNNKPLDRHRPGSQVLALDNQSREELSIRFGGGGMGACHA
jgi:hypothetical protein